MAFQKSLAHTLMDMGWAEEAQRTASWDRRGAVSGSGGRKGAVFPAKPVMYGDGATDAHPKLVVFRRKL